MNLRKLSRPLLLAALFGAVAMGACSLNPQPIPPGEQVGSDAGDKFGAGSADAQTPTTADDSGTSNLGDHDADAEAGDAASDDAGDASADANDI